MKAKLLLLALPLILLPLSSCSQSGESGGIYASFYPIYEFASLVAGDEVKVYNLTPAGSEPHDYTPTAKTVAGLYDADVILVNGLGLENWVDSLPSQLSEKTHEVTAGIETLQIDGQDDPHVWLDPENAITEMENIYEILCSLYPEKEAVFATNLANAMSDFQQLDARLSQIAESTENKYILTSHAAFGYLCQAYGFTQIYLSGLSPDDEPTASALEDIIAAVKEYGIGTVFYEEAVSSEVAEAIASQTGCKTETLNPLETLSQDALDEGDNYSSVMTDNLNKIKIAGGSNGD
ncbi:MAG: zinc ABC transporter substrate-binding protein [Bacillota bacterium]|nr:zinc ABC transporter substrate-binding protein [Bacillota bacterium]